MKLNEEVFTIDCEAQCQRIATFIGKKMTELGRVGIVVAVSGGRDSSTVAALCVGAVGGKKSFLQTSQIVYLTTVMRFVSRSRGKDQLQ